MIRRSSRILLEVAAVVVAGLAILGVAAALRLSAGPLSVHGMVAPYLIDALEPDDGSLKVSVEDTIVAWAGWDRALELRAVGVRIADASGEVHAVVPELSIGLSAAALLRGRLAPTSLEVVGLRLLLRRDEAGAFRFAEAQPTPDAAEPAPDRPRVDAHIMARLIEDLLQPPNPASDMGYLTRLSLLDADVTVDDRRLGAVWRAPSATFTFLRGDRGIRLTGTFGFDIGGAVADLAVDAIYDSEREQVEATIDLAEIQPAMFAARVPALAFLDHVRVPVAGRLRVRAGLDGSVAQTTLDLAGGRGEIALPWAPAGPAVPVRGLVLRGAVKGDLTALDISQLTIDLDGPVVDARLAAKGEGRGILGAPFEATVEAAARDLPAALLHRLWPPGAAEGGRRWVAANIREGRINDARVVVGGASATGALDDLAVVRLDGGFGFSGVTATYFASLPPIRQGRGSATLAADHMVFAIAGGESNGLQIDGGTVRIGGLDTPDQSLAVEAVLRGSVTRALEILDGPRLGYAKELGVRPRDVGGQMATRLAVKLPLIDALTFKQVEIAAAATLRGVTLPKVAFDLDLRDGDFTLQMDGRGMEVAGQARLGETPAAIRWAETFNARDVRRRLTVAAELDATARRSLGLDLEPVLGGTVAVEAVLTETARKARSVALAADLAGAALDLPQIGWRKEIGAPGTAKAEIALAGERLAAIRSFAVEAGDLRAAGDVAFAADGKSLAKLRLTRLSYGHTDVTAEVMRRPGGGFDATVSGRSLDAQPFLDTTEDAQQDETSPPLSVVLAVDHLRLSNGGGLADVSGRLNREGKLWQLISIDGRPAPGKSFTLRVVPDGADRIFEIRSDDAGSVLKALDVTPDFVGGQLRIDARYDDSKANTPLAGQATIEQFRIVNAPALAKLLSVASLTGVLDLLRGDGIGFNRFEAPFTFADGVIETKGARMHGAALGFTAQGWLSLRDDALALRGTVVPAYTLNSILGNIPVLGRLLTGGEGSGVFAATYRMTGKLADPDITVNPLATLTPGFLRGLFGIFEGELPQAPDPSQEREAPPPPPPVERRSRD